MYSQKLLVLSTYPKIKIAAFQWTICGAWQYLATALTAFAISVLVNKAIHKIALIISRKGKRIIGSSTSKFQILQVVGIGMPLPHSTLYFSPDTISVVSRNTIHQHRIRELAEPENMKLHTAYVTMDTIGKQNASQSQTLLLLPPLRLPPSGLMASPQLGPSSISSWVKSVVAPSGLTRHEAEDGSCNREIRVVLCSLLIQLLRERISRRSTQCTRYATKMNHQK